MIGSSVSSSRGSKPLIKNTPAPLQYAGFILGNAPSILSDAVNSALRQELDQLSKELPDLSTEYIAVLEDLYIDYDETLREFVYVVEEESADLARTLEYGTPTQPPLAGLRNAASQGAPRIAKSINESISKVTGK